MFGWLNKLTRFHGAERHLCAQSADTLSHDDQHLQREEEEGEANGLFAVTMFQGKKNFLSPSTVNLTIKLKRFDLRQVVLQ